MDDYTSRVPYYTFPDNSLEDQEIALQSNPLMKRLIASRKSYEEDSHRPHYHYVNPEARLKDPNGLCFWKGHWHLFYQAYPPEDTRQHWGHAISDDLVHWRDLPYCIYPNPERCCYSGSTLVEKDRVIAMYHGTEAGNMVAVSSDPLLLNWKKVSGGPVIPLPKTPINYFSGLQKNGLRPAYNVFDPCIWMKDGKYYSLSAGTKPEGPGGKPIRANFLFSSENLIDWTFLHPFVEDDHYSLVGDDGACPYFWPIGDRYILLFFSHMSGPQYLIGDYDTERNKFVVSNGGKFNFGAFKPSGLHAPSATPDGEGGLVVIFNMNHGKPTNNWDQIMSLPRRLTVQGDDLYMEPIDALKSLRGKPYDFGPIALPANKDVILPSIGGGNTMEFEVEIDSGNSPMVEMNVLQSPNREEFTRIAFYRGRGFKGKSLLSVDSSYSSTAGDVISRAPETAPLALDDNENLKLRVFVDKSVMEVFANDRQCIALRVYPDRPDSTGISFRSQGVDSQLVSFKSYKMKSIWI